MICATEVSILDALLLALVAMAIIMAVLACIMGLIYLMTYTFNVMDKVSPKMKAKMDTLFKKNKDTATQAESADAPKKATAPGSCGSLVLKDVSDRDAAMIMAIVADQMQTPLNELRFKSIALVKNDDDKEVK